MNNPQQDTASSSSLREPLLDPETSSYWVQCNHHRQSEGSLGLEDVMRSWYDQHQQQQQRQDDNDNEEADDANGNENNASDERSCPSHHRPPWYRNPLQIMAMISNFSTSFNVVNISLVLPILKVVLKDSHPVSAEDEVSIYRSSFVGLLYCNILEVEVFDDEGMGIRYLFVFVYIHSCLIFFSHLSYFLSTSMYNTIL